MNDVQQDPSITEDGLQMSVDDAAEAILARWEKQDADESKLSKPNETEATSDIEETDNVEELDEIDETEEENETEIDREEDDTEKDDQDAYEDEGDDEVDDSETSIVPDDAEVEVVINGKSETVSVAALKRLYGQEASLTQKSQRVAEQRKVLEDAIGKNHLAFQRMLDKAKERYKPYGEVDMLVASKAMETEDFAALRKEAEEAFSDLKFLTEEADAFYNEVKNQQQAQLQEAARECVRVLEEEIPDWNNNLYNDIRTYAIKIGLPEDDVNNYTDPKVIMLINKARLYDAGKQVAIKKKKAATTKKTLRTRKAPDTENQRKQNKVAEARARLKNGGNDFDDIAEALLSRWEA
jgi:hypothetical protein